MRNEINYNYYLITTERQDSQWCEMAQFASFRVYLIGNNYNNYKIIY